MRLVEARLRSKSDSWSQAFLTETVKTGAKYRNVSYKIFKSKDVDLFGNGLVLHPILSLESVDYFTTSVSGRRKKESYVMSKTSGTLRW